MLFYITRNNFNDFTGTGKEKKIKGQVAAMSALLGETYYTTYVYPILYLMDGDEVIDREAVVSRRDFTLTLCSWLQKYNVEYSYIRYALSGKWLLDLLQYQKEHGIKTVVEIPTYPYDGEAMVAEDIYFRQKIGKYIGRIATYSADARIWGVECLHLKNGVSLSEICVCPRVKEKGKLVMIAVSDMQYWHGYERILEGMYLYAKDGGSYDIRLKMVGSGPEKARYKELTDRYGLGSRVEFLGRIEVSEKERLKEQYALSDIGIGALGCYKKQVEEGSPIKDAEYCAKGIPFISGYRDLGFPPDWEFMMNVPNGPEPVDMRAVIAFYEHVTEHKNYKEKMKNYAMRYLTWDSIMRPVCDYFLSGQE